MKYYVVEDQQDALELIQSYVGEDYPQLHAVGCANNIVTALDQIPRMKPDLLLLDIHLGIHDGFELLNQLKEQQQEFQGMIIFISAYTDSDHILRAFDFFPLRYIIKPIDRRKLQVSIDQAIHHYNLIWAKSHMKIPVRLFQMNKLRIPKIRGEIELVDLEKILFLQSANEGQTTKIFLSNTTLPINANKNLGYFKDLLQEYQQFFSISQSIIVNLNFLKSYVHHTKMLYLHEYPEALTASRRGGEDLRKWLSGE